jgi:hypothetical protein
MLEAIMLVQTLVCSPTIRYKTPLQNNAEFLGYYVEESIDVKELSPVYIEEDDVQYIEPLTYVWDQTRDDGTKTYYYFANDTHGIIKTIRYLYNDVTSVQYMVSQVESHVKTYLKKNNKSVDIIDINKATIGYLKTFNLDYSNWRFNLTGTTPDSNLVEYINNVSCPFGMSIESFFAQFTPTDKKDKQYHPAQEPKGKQMLESFQYYESIPEYVDLIHMFATISGSLSVSTNPSVAYVWSIDTYGWAGDLQTSVSDGKDFGDNKGSASYNDIFADIDGFNLAMSYMNNGYLLSSAMTSNYNRTRKNPIMFAHTFASFISSYSYLSNEAGRPHDYDDHIVHMLHLQFDGQNNLIESTYSDPVGKFILMGTYNSGNLERRKYVATEFLNFIDSYLKAGYF